MEKIIYILRHDPTVNIEDYAQTLRTRLAEKLRALGVRGLQVNIADYAVSLAASLRQSVVKPPVDTLLNVWVDSAVDKLRKPVDDAVAELSPKFWAYLVCESQPLRNTLHPPVPGERTPGFAQLALLRRPPRLTHEAWREIWHNAHTDIAIETQSSFEYVQNLVVRRLVADGPAFDAIVEECFPEAAMTDFRLFFDAPGDEKKFKQNLQRMMDSVNRFIDPGTLDVVPTSQYVIWPATR